MEVILAKLIEQLNSSVFTLLGLLGVAFWALYRLGGITKTFHVFETKNKELDTHISGMKDTLATIKATTDLLYQAHIQTIKANSPISISSIGATYSTDLKLEEKVAKHWRQIQQEIQKKSPTNPYDIQVIAMEFSRACFDSLFTEQEKSDIKLYAYKQGVNLLEIIPIIGLIIRDTYLQEKGISIDQIDQHAPKADT